MNAAIMNMKPAAVLVSSLLLLLLAAAASAAPADGCPRRCGDVDIPYPFGIGIDCSLEAGFNLTCNETTNKPFLYNIEVLDISLPLGRARLRTFLSWQCYNSTDRSVNFESWSVYVGNSPWRFSDVRNKFTVIGCSAFAYISGWEGNTTGYTSGCWSKCSDELSLGHDGSCSGIGCCQTSVPKDYGYYEIQFANRTAEDFSTNFSVCNYAALVEEESFEFRTSYITTPELLMDKEIVLPFVLDWAIGDKTCEEAQGNRTSYACVSKNSECFNSSNGPGYLCSCSKGYAGNPYLPGGCTDIDECHGANAIRCTGGTCVNLPGSYTCSCPRGKHIDPSNNNTCIDFSKKNNTCIADQKLPLAVKAIIGASSGLASLLLCTMFLCMLHERRKLVKARKRYFREHGGRMLLEGIRGQEGLAFRIFTYQELDKATNGFDKNRVLGQGGYGTVYKGTLEDDSVVAIKKPKVISESQKKEFGREMVILSHINHKNIVKLLGCCLEVEVPMLVYEFVPNGTLFHLIHDGSNSRSSPIPLGIRMKIAYESADALAYLHSSASPPIVHGDVKTSNILLGEDFTAKVSDFGASKLVPKDEDQFATLVQGTCGYLDPEYLQTCQLTEKSDVYSFGVVLLELLTGKKAVYFDGDEQERSLASSFILAMKGNRLNEILDVQVKDGGDAEFIREISVLARQCLNVSGEERPTMKHVADELEKLGKFIQRHPWIPHNAEEIESLLGDDPSGDTSMDTTTAISYSAGKRMAFDIESGR